MNVLYINIIKIFCINVGTYIIALKIANIKQYCKVKNTITLACMFIVAIIFYLMRNFTDFLNSTVVQIILLTAILANNTKNNFSNMLIFTIISLSINYILLFIAVTINYIFSNILIIKNDLIILIILIIIYMVNIFFFYNIKKIKYGFSFLQKNIENEYYGMLTITMSITVLFILLIISNCSGVKLETFVMSLIIFCILMFITIQKSLQLYYKQKLLVQELEETKKELENKKEELQNVEKENINISKKNHTLAHKQKSLEHKIEEMINKSEVSKEEAEELKSRLKEIGKDLYKEKETIELDKTGIPEIDDMMKYMQSECKKNKIEFEYQLKGNIYYMTNNLVSKEDLETLLADHIKNAIIAINHTNNLNRSILVRLGKIDENYGLYIYDSGIEFKPEIFEKLGKEPSTTHPDEGGTGMGFMNTFDTLRKYNASLTIEEYNKPNKDNYTKVLIIKFDGKKEFKIKSYQLKETIKIG